MIYILIYTIKYVISYRIDNLICKCMNNYSLILIFCIIFFTIQTSIKICMAFTSLVTGQLSFFCRRGENPITSSCHISTLQPQITSILQHCTVPIHAVYSRTTTLERPGLVQFLEGPAYSPPGQKFSGSTVLVPLEIPSI